MVMTHTQLQKIKVKGHSVKKVRVETVGQTDGWIQLTALPYLLMQSVKNYHLIPNLIHAKMA